MSFKDKIDGLLKDSDAIMNFLDNSIYKEQNIELVADLTQVSYDSYGDEDSILRYIFKCNDFNKFFEITGTRCSYKGEEFDSWKEVEQKEKIVKYWE